MQSIFVMLSKTASSYRREKFYNLAKNTFLINIKGSATDKEK